MKVPLMWLEGKRQLVQVTMVSYTCEVTSRLVCCVGTFSKDGEEILSTLFPPCKSAVPSVTHLLIWALWLFICETRTLPRRSDVSLKTKLQTLFSNKAQWNANTNKSLYRSSASRVPQGHTWCQSRIYIKNLLPVSSHWDTLTALLF